MDKAIYELIDDPEPFYGDIPELQEVWATLEHRQIMDEWRV